MDNMNEDYKKLLLSVYAEAERKTLYTNKINQECLKNIKVLAEKCFSQKGVYTVFVTLLIYKIATS